jgi:hypothetical protein
MPRLKELSDSMRRVIDDYFVLNKGLYEEQKVVQQLAIIVEGVVQAFSINERLHVDEVGTSERKKPHKPRNSASHL